MHIGINQRIFGRYTALALHDMVADDIRALGLQNGLQLSIADIQVVETRSRINRLTRPMNQAIDDEYIMPGIQIGACQVRTNKTCATNYSYFHSLPLRQHSILLTGSTTCQTCQSEHPPDRCDTLVSHPPSGLAGHSLRILPHIPVRPPDFRHALKIIDLSFLL
jgi:hypothetical protein